MSSRHSAPFTVVDSALCAGYAPIAVQGERQRPIPGRCALRLALPIVLLGACGASPDPCGGLVVWQRGAAAPALLGSWDGFRRPGRTDWERVPAPDGSTWLRLGISLPAGVHRYALYDGATFRIDERNPRSVFVPDPMGASADPYAVEVSEIDLSSCAAPMQRVPPSDGLVYQIMVDRFRGAGPLAAPAAPGDRAGGTLDGVAALVDAGYFERLGVTTLWLSPVYENPKGRLRGRDGHPYEAYHGYWPVAPRTVEPALGGEAALDRLVATAHARGLRVILDAVPNHVHEDHPYHRDHARAVVGERSWFHDGPDACVCGAPGCGWAQRLEDCWFDTYLPDLQLRDPEVIDATVDDLLYWQARFGVDGFRIDAVPMMPRAALRRMVHAVRAAAEQRGRSALLLGETYTGPGDGGRAAIASYLGVDVDGLDSEFDFPLLWATRDAIAHGARGMDELEQEIAAGDRAFAGSGAIIAHTIGNHDTTRFLSEAAGDAGGDPWAAPPPQPAADEPYRRQVLALALTLTLPGLPVLYYGDELGLAGATDPDSRRVLPDVLSPLPPQAARVLEQVARLGRLRRCSTALRGGARVTLLADRDRLVALHGGEVLVALSRAATDGVVELAGVPAGTYRDVLSGATITATGDAPVALPLSALSAAVFLPEASACHE